MDDFTWPDSVVPVARLFPSSLQSDSVAITGSTAKLLRLALFYQVEAYCSWLLSGPISIDKDLTLKWILYRCLVFAPCRCVFAAKRLGSGPRPWNAFLRDPLGLSKSKVLRASWGFFSSLKVPGASVKGLNQRLGMAPRQSSFFLLLVFFCLFFISVRRRYHVPTNQRCPFIGAGLEGRGAGRKALIGIIKWQCRFQVQSLWPIPHPIEPSSGRLCISKNPRRHQLWSPRRLSGRPAIKVSTFFVFQNKKTPPTHYPARVLIKNGPWAKKSIEISSSPPAWKSLSRISRNSAEFDRVIRFAQGDQMKIFNFF